MTKEPLLIYNTLSNKKEVFEPVEPGKLKMYVCGPTTYNYIHLGNARPIVVFDTIRRYFEYLGYEVVYISNFTDVDDKIINRAKEEGKTPKDVAEFYIQAFFEDVGALGVKPATDHPKVSDHIPEIIQFVADLIEKGHAYAMDNGDVYFSVRSFPDYGMLSGRDIDELRSGARIEVDEKKRDPLDFALWKGSKPGEPSWETPWGEGRPGWHIECSAMSRSYLGETFDIHGGGQDLIFPHHENEIAQSCALSHAPMANFWVHNGFITINQEKMSKSLGNFFLLREILERYDPTVVRFYLLSVHYRSPLDFDDNKLDVAAKSLERLQNAYHSLEQAVVQDAPSEGDQLLMAKAEDAEAKFRAAMNDDFNTALGISALFDFAREVNIYMKGASFGKEAVKAAKSVFERLGDVLGIQFSQVEDVGEGQVLTGQLIELFIDLRTEARKDKNFALSDAIRDRLKEIGVVLEDGKQGTTWKIQS